MPDFMTASPLTMPDLTLPDLTFPAFDPFSDSLDTVVDSLATVQNGLAWVMAHPYLSLAIALFSLGLLQLLADSVKRLLKTAIAIILKSPLLLLQWLWQKAITPAPESTEARLAQVLQRLDSLRQEQDALLNELRTLLDLPKTDPITRSPDHPITPSPLSTTAPPAPADEAVSPRS